MTSCVTTASRASSPGLVEALEHSLPQDHPLRALYLGRGPHDDGPRPTVNMLLRHGVQSCLEYVRTGDAERARTLSNAELSPHVSFVDMGGHGYAVVSATSTAIETEFVCIPRPLERSTREDVGPLRILGHLQLPKFAPPRVLLGLGGIGIFIILQPEPKPVDTTALRYQARSRIALYVLFGVEHHKFGRPFQVAQCSVRPPHL